MRERRIHTRNPFDHEIECSFASDTTNGIFKGIGIDISEHGLGMYVFRPLNKGQKIIINGGFQSAQKVGFIRWCVASGENGYRAGVVFGHS
ncbi:MAG TPA: hypothetical protein VEI46_03740 [Thermodesulfovibrionales bacterium]|nr:hypothetical protein [Thermodesulfovibrionales bacterium]